MSLDATPAQASRHLAVLDELCEIGMEYSRLLVEHAQTAGADLHANTEAFKGVAQGIRRAIMLSCSLERLVAAGCQPPAPPRDPAEHRKPDPNAFPDDRGDRLDRGDTLDRAANDDHSPELPVAEQIAGIARDIHGAAATILHPAPKPARPTRSQRC